MKTISIGKNLTAGSETVVYTVPDGYTATWDLMYAHNATGTNKYLTVDWYDVSENTHVHILEQYNFTSKTYFQFSGNGSGVVLESGDQIHMTSESGSSFGIICTLKLERMTYGN
jgi:hypothetical protein